MSVNTPPKKNWVYIFSPCVIVAIIAIMLALYIFIFTASSEEMAYSGLALILLAPCLFALVLLDIIVRAFLKGVKDKEAYIWIIEVLLIGFVMLVAHSARSH